MRVRAHLPFDRAVSPRAASLRQLAHGERPPVVARRHTSDFDPSQEARREVAQRASAPITS
jgi:hypothetical protein